MQPTRVMTSSRVLPVVVCMVAAAVLLVVNPQVRDLQAAIAREDAARSGVGLGYWFNWFGGVSPGSYSVLVPTLSSVVGSMVLACVASVVIAVAGVVLGRKAAHPVAFSWAVAVAAVLNLASGRVAFAVGIAIALVAVVTVLHRVDDKRWRLAGGVLLVISGLASPLAPAFVGILAVALLLNTWRITVRGRVIGDPDRSPPRTQLWPLVGYSAVGVLVPLVLFGNPGAQVFPVTTLVWCLVIAAGLAASLREAPTTWLVPVFVVTALVVFVVPNGVGSNLARFGYFVLPCVALYFCSARLRVVALMIVPAAVYALFVAVSDQVSAADVKESQSLYQPLVAELSNRDMTNHRVELVDADSRAGSHKLGDSVRLARGWENQSDARFNPIFYTDGALTAVTYRRWLAENAVRYVAVATTPVDAGKKEAALIDSGLAYLSRVWGNEDWTLYEVTNPGVIVPKPLTLLAESSSQIDINFPDTRNYRIQVRPNKYLVIRGKRAPMVVGCIIETKDEWISVNVPTPGNYVLEGAFTVRNILGEAPPTCDAGIR